MTGTTELLDPERVRQLFDLANHVQGWNGGNFDADPYPIWHRLREQARGARGNRPRPVGSGG